VRDEPQSSVATTSEGGRLPKGTPAPVVLQRSFTAVTTKKRPQSEGGYEFERPHESMVNANRLSFASRRHHSKRLVKRQCARRGDNLIGSALAEVQSEEDEENDDEEEVEDEEEGEEEEGEKASRNGVGGTCHPKLVLKLGVQQEKMGSVCPKGHPLQPFLTPNPSYSCDAPGCGRKFPQGSSLHGCRDCNFDYCTLCVRAFSASGGGGSGGGGDSGESGQADTAAAKKKRSREIGAATPLFRALHELMVEQSSGGGSNNVVKNLVSISDSYDLDCTGKNVHGRNPPFSRLVSVFRC